MDFVNRTPLAETTFFIHERSRLVNVFAGSEIVSQGFLRRNGFNLLLLGKLPLSCFLSLLIPVPRLKSGRLPYIASESPHTSPTAIAEL